MNIHATTNRIFTNFFWRGIILSLLTQICIFNRHNVRIRLINQIAIVIYPPPGTMQNLLNGQSGNNAPSGALDALQTNANRFLHPRTRPAKTAIPRRLDLTRIHGDATTHTLFYRTIRQGTITRRINRRRTAARHIKTWPFVITGFHHRCRDTFARRPCRIHRGNKKNGNTKPKKINHNQPIIFNSPDSMPSARRRSSFAAALRRTALKKRGAKAPRLVF